MYVCVKIFIPRNLMRNFSFYLVSFICGFSLLANELISAKILSITFGNTIHTWAILLSITLLSLAAGYYFAGWLIKKRGTILTYFSMLIFLLLIISQFIYVPLSMYVANLFIDFAFGSLLFCFISIGPTIFILGTITPLIIHVLQTDSVNKIGFIAGRVYGISTLGSIVSCFTYGLFFLPEKGVIFSSMSLVYLLLIPFFIVIFYKKAIK